MKQREILFLLGSIMVVVFVWIAFTLLHNTLTSTISGELTQAIVPIQPTFNTKIIEALKTRTVVKPVFTIQPPSQTAIVVSTAPETATFSGQIASPEGSLQ